MWHVLFKHNGKVLRTYGHESKMLANVLADALRNQNKRKPQFTVEVVEVKSS